MINDYDDARLADSQGEEFTDPDDRVIYEVALAEPDSRLVTGNLKHYPVTPIVVTPAQFCELIETLK